MDIKPILQAGVAAQAAGLALHNYNFAMKKKPTVKRMLTGATTSIVGISLLKAQSDIIGGL